MTKFELPEQPTYSPIALLYNQYYLIYLPVVLFFIGDKTFEKKV